MKKIERIRWLALLVLFGGILASCSFPSAQPAEKSQLTIQATPALADAATLKLEIQADTSVPIGVEGQIVKVSYLIKNTGTTSIIGQMTIAGAAVACPALNTVGNLDNVLDVKETLVCTGDYAVTKADLDYGSLQITAVATIGGVSSKQVTVIVPIKILTLTKTADPAAFDRVGQPITYTYAIKNSGVTVIGPTQFIVNDPSLGAPFNCGEANTQLNPGDTVTCKATYTITQADLDAGTVTSSAIAAANGVEPSPEASLTLTKSGVVTNPANLAVGSSIQHKVVAGEWLWQIARCYGVDPKKIIQANPQLSNPAQISPDMLINVPTLGSAGTLYGTPCVVKHTVQPGETWESIAQQHNADLSLLKMVNKSVLSNQVTVPRNSAGGMAAPK